MNEEWHRRHVMPKNATQSQRLDWHRAHQKQCACRPIPASLQALMTRPPSSTTRASSSQAATKAKEEPVLAFTRPAEFGAWLASHHDRSGGVRLRIGKRSAKSASISYAEALDLALAWGWIDSQKWALDETAWLQRFTRRTAKSPWSKINRARAEALIAAQAMRPPGLAAVERAQQDGRWQRAYDGARASQVPPDLAAALARNARARAFFETLDGTNRYAILYRIQTAKKPETRAERIARFVALCARHETIHPRRPSRPK